MAKNHSVILGSGVTYTEDNNNVSITAISGNVTLNGNNDRLAFVGYSPSNVNITGNHDFTSSNGPLSAHVWGNGSTVQSGSTLVGYVYGNGNTFTASSTGYVTDSGSGNSFVFGNKSFVFASEAKGGSYTAPSGSITAGKGDDFMQLGGSANANGYMHGGGGADIFQLELGPGIAHMTLDDFYAGEGDKCVIFSNGYTDVRFKAETNGFIVFGKDSSGATGFIQVTDTQHTLAGSNIYAALSSGEVSVV